MKNTLPNCGCGVSDTAVPPVEPPGLPLLGLTLTPTGMAFFIRASVQ